MAVQLQLYFAALPGGYKDHFEARTVYYPHNKVEIRQTKEIPMQDMAEMEVLLKVIIL